MVLLSEIESIQWTDSEGKSPASVSVSGRTFGGISSAVLLLCPANRAVPKRSDCLTATHGSFEIQWVKGDGYTRRIAVSNSSTVVICDA
jgi:hypothetical protein